MKKLLIIGAGGYISAIVIPTLKEYFKDVEITVLSKISWSSLKKNLKNWIFQFRNLLSANGILPFPIVTVSMTVVVWQHIL